MKNPRFTGLLLLLTGVLVLMGNTLDVLPPAAFWAGLVTYPIGGYLFFTGSRQAIEKFETRATRSQSPKPAADEGHAPRPAQRAASTRPPEKISDVIRSFDPNAESRTPDSTSPRAQGAGAPPAGRDQLALYEIEADGDASGAASGNGRFKVTPAAPRPTETQEAGSVADQIEKLAKLHRQGIISAEELAVAKAKLLG